MDHKKIIDDLGGPARLAADANFNRYRVTGWRQRNSIPVRAWPAIIEVASARGIDLTTDALMAGATSQGGVA